MLQTLRSERAQLLGPSRTHQARAPHSLEGLLWNASLNNEPETLSKRWLMVSGLIDDDSAVLLPTISVPGPRSALSGIGPYELFVEDATGHVLARAAVGGGFSGDQLQPFAVTVPVIGEPARVVLGLGNETLAESRSDSALAAPKVSSHKPGSIFRAGDTLAWGTAHDEGITYTVNFTANGQDWRKLAVLLSQPSFKPDPQVLMPGPGAAFEIIAHDGLTERATRLPVEIDAPLMPLVPWPGDGEGASLDFNVAIDADTLGAASLLADGVPVNAVVKLSSAGRVLTIAPRSPDATASYTAVVDTTLQAEDGRSLESPVTIDFQADLLEPQDHARSWDPATQAALAARAPADDPNEAKAPPIDEKAQPPALFGEGQIKLEVGGGQMAPARILLCEQSNDGELLGLEMDFETTPGDWVKIAMAQSEDGQILATAELGNRAALKSEGQEGDDWQLYISKGIVTARGQINVVGQTANFALTGRCPV